MKIDEFLVETIEYRSHEIKVYQDECPDTPDEWCDHERFLVYEHRDFTIKREGFDPREILQDRIESKKILYSGYYVFPVFAYIHGDITLALSKNNYPFTCRWDTSLCGCILIKRMKGSFHMPQVYRAAEQLIKIWNDYLSGNIYGYVTIDDSCWGYYGLPEKSGLLDDAKNSIDFYIDKKRKEWFSLLKKWIKAGRPIQYRTPAPDICFI